ncbi:MAG TPA: hypothetical protein VHJ82_03285, partial [Actinomycetota bacterium]|nr:hypothetical protein [Actinomycetota bacterium]
HFAEASESDSAAPEPKLGRTYDPRPEREHVRGRLAAMLSVLLATMALAPFMVVVTGWATWAEVEGPVTLGFGPIVGLVGTVLGFYFGSQRTDS